MKVNYIKKANPNTDRIKKIPPPSAEIDKDFSNIKEKVIEIMEKEKDRAMKELEKQEIFAANVRAFVKYVLDYFDEKKVSDYDYMFLISALETIVKEVKKRYENLKKER